MVKKLLLLALLASTLRPAAAQNPLTDESLASQQLKQRLRGQYLRNDTAQALITLYSRRQAGGVGWIVAATLSAVRLSIGTTTTTNYGGYAVTQDNSGNPAAAFLCATPFMAYGLGKLLHYSNAHLQAVLAAYAMGQPLPRALRRKLKPRFFATPIIKYKSINVNPIK